MKSPDWKRSPSWANWACMDEDNIWYWFEHKPIHKSGTWQLDCCDTGKYQSCNEFIKEKGNKKSSIDSLQERPAT